MVKNMNALIISDLDGTLLHNHFLSKKKVDYLHSWIESGNDFWVATGRSPTESEIYIRPFAYNRMKQIYHNGGLVMSNKKVVAYNGIDERCFNNIMHVIIGCNMLSNTIIYGLKNTYVFNPSEEVIQKIKKLNTKPVVNSPINEISILRILILCINELSLKQICERIKKIAHLSIIQNRNNTIDILKEDTNKGQALSQILNSEDYDKVFAFGDSQNDISMKLVGVHFIAVKDGLRQVQDIADKITCSSKDNIFYMEETNRYLLNKTEVINTRGIVI